MEQLFCPHHREIELLPELYQCSKCITEAPAAKEELEQRVKTWRKLTKFGRDDEMVYDKEGRPVMPYQQMHDFGGGSNYRG